MDRPHWDDHPRRVDTHTEVARFEATKRQADSQQDEDDDFELADADVLDMARNPETFCVPYYDEDGHHPDDTHADPDEYTDAQILEMADALSEACVDSNCPLHMDRRYPKVPVGIWQPQVSQAWDALARMTVKRTGQTLAEWGGDDHPFRVTPDELRQVWKDSPHARWYFEVTAGQGVAEIEVIE